MNSEQIATLPQTGTSNAKNLDRDKERIETLKVVSYYPEYAAERGWGEPIFVAVQARFWKARRGNGMNPIYCTVWIDSPGHNGKRSFSGHGKAGGCGYHKMSAALDAALRSAGVKLAFEPCGDSAMESALIAVAVACGWPSPQMI